LEMLYARQKVVAYAKANDLQAIDLVIKNLAFIHKVCVEYQNVGVLEQECQEGKSFGFTGKVK
jgi:citrate lyase beta subunit